MILIRWLRGLSTPQRGADVQLIQHLQPDLHQRGCPSNERKPSQYFPVLALLEMDLCVQRGSDTNEKKNV